MEPDLLVRELIRVGLWGIANQLVTTTDRFQIHPTHSTGHIDRTEGSGSQLSAVYLDVGM